MSLYPTPRRLALLRAVHAGDVVDGPDEHGFIHAWEIDPPYKPRKVNAQIARLIDADWVDCVGHKYALTAAGMAVVLGTGGGAS